MKFNVLILQIIIVLFMVSCQRPAPQLPANKLEVIDSTGIGLLKLNEKMILSEDSLIRDYVENSKVNYVKHDLGFWYKIAKSDLGNTAQANQECEVAYRVYSIENNFLFEKKETIIIGKKQLPTGIEEALKIMRKGAKADLVIPWYLAYGMKGNGNEIKPYTSLVVNLQWIK